MCAAKRNPLAQSRLPQPGRADEDEAAHDIPLSRQALAVLRGIWDVSEGNALVFPSIRSTLKPLSENAMNSALRRMGCARDEMCTHGFRPSASTIPNERAYDPGVIEVALAHQYEDETRAVYKRQSTGRSASLSARLGGPPR
jgi:integrase